ncbi:hypothetical protein AOB57_003695 [Methanosarcina flavescens]|uniref:Uncharacterized protein n=1 Tax=Methanosarcina flavescens TaxID=1715806 RepID=A0A660HQ86_9EURY|nr:hypothetical protein AOB57_003695 [Methanosarcina flavescens]
MNEFTVPFGTHKGFAGKNFSPYAINLQGLFKIFFSLTANIYIRIQLNLQNQSSLIFLLYLPEIYPLKILRVRNKKTRKREERTRT